jgi:hypothetical protein
LGRLRVEQFGYTVCRYWNKTKNKESIIGEGGEKMEQKTMTWKDLRNQYKREWLKKHPEKRRLYEERYWTKKLKELKQK